MDELEKRRMIMKNVKKEIDKDEALAKEKFYQKKMSELEQKVIDRDSNKKNKSQRKANDKSTRKRKEKQLPMPHLISWETFKHLKLSEYKF